MSGDPGRELEDALARQFLRDLGLTREERAPSTVDDEEFARLALELGRIGERELERARREAADRPGTPLWRILVERGDLALDDVAAALRLESELEVGARRAIGRYLLAERVGEGGGGRVFRAIDSELLRTVALKVLVVPPDAPRAARERFRREAEALARLDHPGIARVHDVGADGDAHYIAMEFVEGVTLARWLEQGPSTEDRLALLEDVARAIHHAHTRGVLHRDLKPSNVLVRPEGRPVVVDFGLARLDGEATLTRAGAVLGTPGHMAPEQERGDHAALGPWTDVFALGGLLRAAFPADGEPPPPPGVLGLAARAADPDPRTRPASALALADDLRRLRAGERPHLLRGARTRRWRRRIARTARVLLVPVLASGLFLLAWFGARTLAENRRLALANEVQGAYALLSTRLEPVLYQAEEARDDPAVDGAARRRIVDLASAVVAGGPDGHGTGAALVGWVRFLVRDEGAEEALAEVARAHPENPVPDLLLAGAHLRRYAEGLRWPERAGVSLHEVHEPEARLVPLETPALRGELDEARRLVAEARRAPIGSGARELAWIERLCRGVEAFADGELAAATRELEAARLDAPLAVEPALVLALAAARNGELDRAEAQLEALLARRPNLSPALRLSAACLRQQAVERLRKGEPAAEWLARAERRLARCPDDIDVRVARAALAVAVAEDADRQGVDATELWREALGRHDLLIASGEAPPGVRANRSVCLAALAERAEDPGPLVERALADAKAAERALGPQPALVAHRIGLEIQRLKRERTARALRAEELEAVRAELRALEEQHGAWGTTHYHAASIELLEVERLGRAGRDVSPALGEAARRLGLAVESDPEFHQARFLLLWVDLFRTDADAPRASEWVRAERALRERFAAAGRPFPPAWDDSLAARLEAVLRSPGFPPEKVRVLAEAWGRALDGRLVREAATPDLTLRRLVAELRRAAAGGPAEALAACLDRARRTGEVPPSLEAAARALLAAPARAEEFAAAAERAPAGWLRAHLSRAAADAARNREKPPEERRQPGQGEVRAAERSASDDTRPSPGGQR